MAMAAMPSALYTAAETAAPETGTAVQVTAQTREPEQKQTEAQTAEKTETETGKKARVAEGYPAEGMFVQG